MAEVPEGAQGDEGGDLGDEGAVLALAGVEGPLCLPTNSSQLN